MKRKRVTLLVALSLAAALLIGLGVLRVVRIYQHYRADMLTYETRHLSSIVSTGGRGIAGMLDAYSNQVEQYVYRREYLWAEMAYETYGTTDRMWQLIAAPSMLRPALPNCSAIYNTDGVIIAYSSYEFPVPGEDDELLTDGVTVRKNDAGVYWFVFSAQSEMGYRYEMAIPVQAVFGFQSGGPRVDMSGYLFLTDKAGSFVAYSGDEESGILSVDELAEQYSSLRRSIFPGIVETADTWAGGHFVYRSPWSSSAADSGEETLVVASNVLGGENDLVLGTAVSFRAFNSFLSDTLSEVTGVAIMELFGALILFFIVAWTYVENRRDRMELEAVRERADLMEEINRQQQSLAHSERLQQLGVMTSGMVHEFNNMLTPIMGQSMLLLEQIADQEDSQQFESALDIYEASETARDVLRRISAMGKKDVDMRFRVISVGELLKKMMNLAAMARDPHIVQELILPDKPIYISGNEQLLTQAILNICINACQAMGTEGRLTVQAETEDRSGQSYAVIRVSDTGPGIPQEMIGNIYDPFYTTKGERGTGLGLAICQKIIETHKGTIQAANREEGGAVFTVRIPTCEPPEED